MRRIISLLIALLLMVSVFAGCNEMPTVDKSVKPEEHITLYKKLTDLYGVPWRDVLKELSVDLQQISAEGLNYVGIPMKENYAGLEFDVFLRFGGDDEHLLGVEYTATYQYPEDEARMLRDLVKINRELISDFGAASDTSLVFNWAEKRMGEKWNRDIAYWQDVQVLKRLLDNDYSGTLLLWNLNSVAPEQVKTLGRDHSLSVSFNILSEEDNTAVITINY